ncbi:hypothetical protein MTR67_031869 [Solanum verrucosum]|uniref:Uncharacterized protein n=1 Tax=Solanum verrucosum TaxID=315347 RepID=A0AAF0U3F7_SOLVR|nr:hypothetical protein MTR67_031869 [Solanum verrucosum]
MYLPLKPRLQRIFMCPETTANMKWQDTERPKDGNIRHSADGEAWKNFDSLHEDFARDPRNVRLGLSSDGFNPFQTMSISHSTWCNDPKNKLESRSKIKLGLKVSSVFFSKFVGFNIAGKVLCQDCTQGWNEWVDGAKAIKGLSSPGKDIDVYHQPLIAELKELWETGIETYDADSNQTFQLRAGLLWTISDFPTYAMLSGWSTKGRKACPTCNHGTCSQYLKHSRKMCYMGHRAFLPHDHPFRRDKKSFDGKEDHRSAPTPLSGTEVLEELREFNNVFGKGQKWKRRDSEGPWKKSSIFFELPY